MNYHVTEIEAPGYEEKAKLTVYSLDNSQEMDLHRVRPMVLVVPGGGYSFTSDREAEPIAIQYLAAGFQAAVIRYSVSPSRFPVALYQLAGAVKYLKDNAEVFHIDPKKIVINGFSAGAHLCGCLGTMWNEDFLKDAFHVSGDVLRPAGMILGYPVITSGKFAHEGSFRNLLGDRYEAEKEKFSLENRVTGDTIPAFLWHTTEDNAVPVENSILFYSALHAAGIPVEMHIFPKGSHGLALANAETAHDEGNIVDACTVWISLAARWVKEL